MNELKTNILNSDAKFIRVGLWVDDGYWEDSTVNGIPDSEGKIPLRLNDAWVGIIDIDKGKVQDWPTGICAGIHYKVGVDPACSLMNEAKEIISTWSARYVSHDVVCLVDKSMKDYWVFEIDENGFIKEWKKPAIDDPRWKRQES